MQNNQKKVQKSIEKIPKNYLDPPLELLVIPQHKSKNVGSI